MADGGVPTEIAQRDEELARLRAEAARRAAKADLTIATLLAPGRLEGLAKYAVDPEKLNNAAMEWARARMNTRLRLVRDAQVPISDMDRMAVALLAPQRKRVVRDGVIIASDYTAEEMREMSALKILREKFLAGHPPFTKSPALTAVRNVLYDRSQNRLVKSVVSLLGSTGVGKTCAAAHGIASLEGSRYIKARPLCDLFSSFHRDDRAELRALYAAPLLAIDEVSIKLAAERPLGAALDELIDSRQGSRRITLLLGNVKPADLAKMVDTRTHSRLERIGTMVVIAEQDRRKA